MRPCLKQWRGSPDLPRRNPLPRFLLPVPSRGDGEVPEVRRQYGISTRHQRRLPQCHGLTRSQVRKYYRRNLRLCICERGSAREEEAMHKWKKLCTCGRDFSTVRRTRWICSLTELAMPCHAASFTLPPKPGQQIPVTEGLVACAATSSRVTAYHPNSEVKLDRARVVLWWGTTREGRVLHIL